MAYIKYKWHRSVAARDKPCYPQRRRSSPAFADKSPSQWYGPVASKEGEPHGKHSEWGCAYPDGGSAISPWDARTWLPSQWDGTTATPVTHMDGATTCKTWKDEDQFAFQSWSDALDDTSDEREQCGSRAEVCSDSTRSQDMLTQTQGDKCSESSSYPRFATYVRRSSCKRTFIHFSETKYDTRQSVDDANITYREYANDTISRGRISNSASKAKGEQRGGPQTLMICNIPCRFTQQELMAMLNAKGFGSTYNFFYLPMDGKRASKPHAVKKASNLGYAFVNFRSPQDAARFQAAFHGFCFVGYDGTLSKKVCKVAPARMQGFYENIRCYQRRIICDDARNSPFIDVPLKRFDMDISKFIEWVFSPTDIAQFLPACKDPSWAEDTITCDDVLPYSIEDQNELRYRKSEQPLVSSPP